MPQFLLKKFVEQVTFTSKKTTPVAIIFKIIVTANTDTRGLVAV